MAEETTTTTETTETVAPAKPEGMPPKGPKPEDGATPPEKPAEEAAATDGTEAAA